MEKDTLFMINCMYSVLFYFLCLVAAATGAAVPSVFVAVGGYFKDPSIPQLMMSSQQNKEKRIYDRGYRMTVF
ncbi:hypothetical protein BDF14DRAFT_1870101 [Spinellus fusiger]|nr:hypothetical protein BDF14DRAFT_1870101 [Spinellus fusiger]